MMSVEKLTYSQTLSQLLHGLADVASQDDVKVTGLTVDSRTVNKGDLFIAYKNTDIMVYVKSAIDAGASAVVIEREQLPDIPKYNVPVIALSQLRAQAGLIAARFYKQPSHDMKVIGVTGTNGKTTVSYLIAQALDIKNPGSSGLVGTLGYGPFNDICKGPNTTPEPVALQNTFANLQHEKIDTVAMEVSSHGLEEYRVSGVEFDIAVFTNLSRDHLDYHQTMENYAASKRRLFSDYLIRKAVINLDDAFGRELIEEFQNKIELVGYSLKTVSQHQIPVVSANIISSNASGMTLQVNSPWGEGTLNSGLIGEFNASNLLASLSALYLSAMPFTEALSALSKCSGIPGRMESFRHEGKPVVIVDYAHTPDALKQVLLDLQSQSSGKLICVFGCGGDRDQGKRAEMGGVAEAIADYIFLTNDNPRYESAEVIIEDIISGIKDHACFTKELDRRNAIMAAIDSASSNDVVLIAGKGHEDYQEIDGVRHPFSDRSIVQEILNDQKAVTPDD
jgi:UDP-N-acetylmuramoyl-L-alanyl-D-glutamate--2,6-diaminopimelate ligase